MLLTRRLGSIALASVIALVVFVTPAAAAIIEVSPRSMAAGATSDVSIRVTNDQLGADLTKIEFLLSGAEVISADAPNRPGWSSSVEVNSAGVDKVAWERGRLAPDASETFVVTLTLGRVGDRLQFSSVQTYSDNRVTRDSGETAPSIAVTGGRPAPTTSTTSTTPRVTAAPGETADKGDEGGGGITTGQALMAFGVVILLVVFKRSSIMRKSADKS